MSVSEVEQLRERVRELEAKLAEQEAQGPRRQRIEEMSSEGELIVSRF
jgi:uncharacterized coiled-coil protein SlyX